MALAIDVMRFGLHRDLRKIRQESAVSPLNGPGRSSDA